MKRYFLAYEVPLTYASDEAKGLEFSNRIDNALELVPTIAMDATPFARTRVFAIYDEGVGIQDIKNILSKELPEMNYALFLEAEENNFVFETSNVENPRRLINEQIWGLNKQMSAALEKMDKNYTLCCAFYLNEDKPTYLGSKEERKCRFCGRTKAEGATFKKKAHAISNLVGNRQLFSYYECDECNEKFSHYESDFAEYLKPYHAVLKVYGKRGVPKYKQYLSNIDNSGDKIKINVFEEDPTIKVDVDPKTNRLSIKCRRSYVPNNVYKSLLKMALTIMPEDDVKHFSSAINFINNEKAVAKMELPVFEQIFGRGYDVFRFVSASIFKRKEGVTDNVFAYTFILAYNNFCFQMPLIGCDLDTHLNGQTVEMTILPTPPLIEGYKLIKNQPVHLSSAQKVSNEEVSLTMSFEAMKEEDLSSTKTEE